MQNTIDRVFLSIANRFEFNSDLEIELCDEDIQTDLDFGRATPIEPEDWSRHPTAKELS